MIKIIFRTSLFFALFLCVATNVLPASAATESISSFTSEINPDPDGSILITETIVYEFNDNVRHGIFRDIPLTSKDGPNLNIDVRSVVNEASVPYNYVVSENDQTIHIKIGDPNVTLSGEKIYRLSYRVLGAWRLFPARQELYWNVTGNEWPVEISKSSAIVTLPSEAVVTDNSCYTGPLYSTEKECSYITDALNGKISAIFSSLNVLPPNSGLTISLSFPLGNIVGTTTLTNIEQSTKPSAGGETTTFAASAFLALVIGVPVAMIGTLFYLVFRKKPKPQPIIPKSLQNRSIVAAYDPPDKLPAIDVGTIFDRKVDPTDISAVIIDLAIRGYLHITYSTIEHSILPDEKEYTLTKQKDGATLTHPADVQLFNFFFRNNRTSITLNEIYDSRRMFYNVVQQLSKDTVSHLTDAGYFDGAAKKRYKKIVIIVFVLFIILSVIKWGGPGIFIMTFTAVFVGAIFQSLINPLTPKGEKALEQILGYRLFLEVTETDRLAFFNKDLTPPQIFEKCLPYAMVFGVSEEWTKRFENMFQADPTWFTGSNHGVFSSVMFSKNLTALCNGVNTASRVASGSGGGGHSGGGGGGGGGGSW